MPAPTAYSPPPYVFLALGLAFFGFLFVQYARNAALKRIVWPVTVLLLALSFLPFFVRFGGPSGALMSLPFIFIYLRYVFCSNCGATISRESLFVKPKFCSQCGARMSADA